MADAMDASTKAPKERSPGFPFIPLETALRRLEEFEAYFGRHPGKADLAGLAWGMKGGSSKSGQTLAALKYFGFIDYSGSGQSRTASLTDFGRTYLRAQQDSIKQEVVREAALKPKVIKQFFQEWGADRPQDPICLDELVLGRKFTDAAAKLFLKVYDQTIAYAGLSDSDTPGEDEQEPDDSGGEDVQRHVEEQHDGRLNDPGREKRPPSGIGKSRLPMMDTERVLAEGLLSKSASFRVLVQGAIGDREIERLIAKLELDKEILADDDDETEGE